MTNKTVFITGAAKRIGMEIAIFFAKTLGYNVAIHCNNSVVDAENLKNKICGLGVKCEIFQSNLLDVTQSVRMLQDAINEFGKIDVLINNASAFWQNNISNVSESDFDRDFNIHLKSPLFLMQKFSEQRFMGDQKGHVINMLDKNIVRRNTKYLSYLLSKQSLHNLTFFAAHELAPLHICVNGIAPGYITEPVHNHQMDLDKKLSRIPMGTKGEVSNITHAIRFILESEYTTGQTIFVDGGDFLV